MHVVIIDNGRSALLGTEYESVLRCIRCGSCIDHCPVWRHIGGQAYGSPYSGPIGAVITPLLGGPGAWPELPFASSLCGACEEVCPARIPLPDLLLGLRADVVRDVRQPAGWRLGMRAFAAASERPWAFGSALRALACARNDAPPGDAGAPARATRCLAEEPRPSGARRCELPLPVAAGREGPRCAEAGRAWNLRRC